MHPCDIQVWLSWMDSLTHCVCSLAPHSTPPLHEIPQMAKESLCMHGSIFISECMPYLNWILNAWNMIAACTLMQLHTSYQYMVAACTQSHTLVNDCSMHTYVPVHAWLLHGMAVETFSCISKCASVLIESNDCLKAMMSYAMSRPWMHPVASGATLYHHFQM